MPAQGDAVTLVGKISTVIVARGSCVNTTWDPSWQPLVNNGFMDVYAPPIFCRDSAVISSVSGGGSVSTVAGRSGNVVLTEADIASLTQDLSARVAKSDVGILADVHNITEGKLWKWKKALQNVRAGTADARILCVGDSTTWGYGGTPSSPVTAGSYPAWLAKRLNASGFAPSAAGLGVARSDRFEDTRWTATNWNNAGSLGQLDAFGWGAMGNGYWCTGTTGATLTFAPAVLADTFDVYYFDNSGVTAPMTIQSTGGSVVNIAAGSTTQTIQKATVTSPTVSASNTVTITAGTVSGKNCWIFAIEPRRSDIKQVLVGNAGSAGSHTTGWNALNSLGLYGQSPLNMIKNYAPDLTIIDLGVNDSNPRNIHNSPATFATNLNNIIAAAQVTGDVILKTMLPSGGADLDATTYQTQYVAGMLTLGLPVIDVYTQLQGGNSTAWNSYNSAGFMYDTIHGNNYSYSEEAQWVLEALRIA